MRSALTGIRAASRSILRKGCNERHGFTLIEALVALGLILAFAAALGPHLFQARRIAANPQGRITAQMLLRSLLEAPIDRAHLGSASREGETAGFRWRISAQPMGEDTTPESEDRVEGAPHGEKWVPFRILASVAWAPDEVVAAETIRLGHPESQ